MSYRNSPSGATFASGDSSIGPKIVVKTDPNVVVNNIAITIIFECCLAIHSSFGVAPSAHNESVATRTKTALKLKVFHLIAFFLFK